MIFYKNTNDLSEKIIKISNDEKLRKKIAKAGKDKYLKYFNSTKVAEYIIEKTYPQKETERKIPTIKSLASKDLKKLVTDWFRLRHVKSKTIKLSPIDR